jgi:hypothetical protein
MTGATQWTCPKCGNRLVSPKMWHSCGRFDLEQHFLGTDPLVRTTFDRFLEEIRGFGPVTVIPQKTRIAIQAEVRFASGVARKHWFDAALWLRRAASHPSLHKIEVFGHDFYHWFRLRSPSDIDAGLVALIGEAYQVGLRSHLRARPRSRKIADQ